MFFKGDYLIFCIEIILFFLVQYLVIALKCEGYL